MRGDNWTVGQKLGMGVTTLVGRQSCFLMVCNAGRVVYADPAIPPEFLEVRPQAEP